MAAEIEGGKPTAKMSTVPLPFVMGTLPSVRCHSAPSHPSPINRERPEVLPYLRDSIGENPFPYSFALSDPKEISLSPVLFYCPCSLPSVASRGE